MSTVRVEVVAENEGQPLPTAWSRVQWGKKNDFVAICDEGPEKGKVIVPWRPHAFKPPKKKAGTTYFILAALIEIREKCCVGRVAHIFELNGEKRHLAKAGYVAGSMDVAKVMHERNMATLTEKCHVAEKARQERRRAEEAQRRMERKAIGTQGEMALRLYDLLSSHNWDFEQTPDVDVYKEGIESEEAIGKVVRLVKDPAAVWRAAAPEHMDVLMQMTK
jgi:hypothetical protein